MAFMAQEQVYICFILAVSEKFLMWSRVFFLNTDNTLFDSYEVNWFFMQQEWNLFLWDQDSGFFFPQQE